jgi:signal transduction histidine kinase
VAIQFSGSDAVLEVRDRGEGIAAEHLSQISEPFFRPDSSRQRHTGGFGLGLYLCRLIAEAHGGRLEIESAPGVGTCVRVLLPIRSS